MARFSRIRAAFFVITAFNFAMNVLVEGEQNAGVTFLHTGGEGSLHPEECSAACTYRCSATSHKKPCLFYCNNSTSAVKNVCVFHQAPIYGHKEECACYNNWKTRDGHPKCP